MAKDYIECVVAFQPGAVGQNGRKLPKMRVWLPINNWTYLAPNKLLHCAKQTTALRQTNYCTASNKLLHCAKQTTALRQTNYNTAPNKLLHCAKQTTAHSRRRSNVFGDCKILISP